MYIVIYTHTYIYTNTYIRTQVCGHLAINFQVNQSAFIHTYITYIHTYIHIHICIHTYIYIHTYMYIHTYIRTQFLNHFLCTHLRSIWRTLNPYQSEEATQRLPLCHGELFDCGVCYTQNVWIYVWHITSCFLGMTISTIRAMSQKQLWYVCMWMGIWLITWCWLHAYTHDMHCRAGKDHQHHF